MVCIQLMTDEEECSKLASSGIETLPTYVRSNCHLFSQIVWHLLEATTTNSYEDGLLYKHLTKTVSQSCFYTALKHARTCYILYKRRVNVMNGWREQMAADGAVINSISPSGRLSNVE